ncbi:hypothetical protein M0802_012600 [Mischocyttarus mexicanus]|nr:hypothetical protein M0802_012600 [Mischocyttarus mexicanus]
MRRNPLECFMFFLFLIVSGRESTSLRDNLFQENDLVSSINSKKTPLSIISPIDYSDKHHSCLYVPPDLPSCQFIRNKNVRRFYRSINNERIHSNIESNYHGHVTVYSLQGCIPSRLPFKMMLCESKDLLKKATKIWKLYPFKIEEEKNIGSTYIFPQFDLNQWYKSMRLLREDKDKQKRSNDQVDALKTSRKYLSSSMISFESNHNQNDLIKSSSSSIINDDNTSNSLMNNRKRRRRKRSLRSNRREIRRGSEFPYSKSIPFDYKKLNLTKN